MKRTTMLLYLVALGACSAGGGEAGPIAEYMNALPRWEEANPQTAPTGTTPGAERETPMEVAEYLNTAGQKEPAKVICEEQDISLATNFRDMVTMNPTAGLIWPGQLIQGASRTGSATELVPLIIASEDRTPITIFLQGLSEEASVVESPSGSAVDTAQTRLVEQARGKLPSKVIDSTIEVFQSQSDFAFKQGFSGKYLGWEGDASVNYMRHETENSVVVYYVEQMYTVVADPPSSPSAWFGPGFTQEKLDQKIAAGDIGPDNLPLYISSVTYGRIMMVTYTASVDAETLEAALRVEYGGLLGGATSTTNVNSSEIVRNSRWDYKFYGGSTQSAQDAIGARDLNFLGAYLSTPVALSEARPISFVLSTMNGTVARVTDATQYTIQNCRKVTGAGFEFLPVQELALSFPASRETHTGDFNGDGRTDILFAHDPKSIGAEHQLAVAYGRDDGTFDFEEVPADLSPESHGGTGAQLEVGDIDGDGRDDAIWWDPNGNDPRFHYLMWRAGGAVLSSSPLDVPIDPGYGPLTGYRMTVGEFWPATPGVEIALATAGSHTRNRVYRLDFDEVDAPFVGLLSDIGFVWRDIGSTGWNAFSIHRAIDLIGDGTDDMMFSRDFVHTWAVFVDIDGVFWAGEQSLGNFNRKAAEVVNFHVAARQRNGKEGYFWLDPDAEQPTVRLWEWPGTNWPPFALGEQNFVPGPVNTSAAGYFDGDATADFVVNALGGDPGNVIRVGFNLNPATGTFGRTAEAVHPENDPSWHAARLHAADVNGDTRDDLVWTIDDGLAVKVYVAVRRN